MGRLAVVRSARLDPVVGANRHLEGLLLVAVEIAYQQDVRCVFVGTPAFEGREDGLAADPERRERQASSLRGRSLP